MSATLAARITTSALRVPLQRPTFSTTARYRAAGTGPGKSSNKPDDIEIPAFNIRHITSNPRTRRFLIACFCVLASVEAYGWYNFGPKILGWEKSEEEK